MRNLSIDRYCHASIRGKAGDGQQYFQSAGSLDEISGTDSHGAAESNLVRSTKGFKGGYVLTRPAKEISLRTVIDALDVTVLADVHFQEESETPLKTIVNHQLWNPMTTYLRKFCDSITISDMMEQYRTFLSDTEGPMYYI